MNAAVLTAAFPEVNPRLVGTLRLIYGWQQEAIDDAAAFAWLQAVRRYRGEGGALFSWLLVVARRHLARMVAGEVRERTSAPAEPLDHVPDFADDFVELAEKKARLARLDRNQRRALGLQAFGFSITEVSALAGTGTFTWADRHLKEGRAALRAAA